MSNTTTPQHVAIICDGNRRWAKSHSLEAVMGHKVASAKVFEPLVKTAVEHGISFLTFWVFSTENWNRPKAEVSALMELFEQQLIAFEPKCHSQQIRIKVIGDLSRLPDRLRDKVQQVVESTATYKTITLIFAMNYGGRDELTRTMQKIAQQVAGGSLSPTEVSADNIASSLDTAGIPDPDMIIRTSGEMRLSGFLPWQSTYAELFFIKEYFPEFTPEVFERELEEFSHRQRRFGAG